MNKKKKSLFGKYGLILLSAAILFLLVGPHANADSFISMLIPSDYSPENLHEIKFENINAGEDGETLLPFVLYYYYAPGDYISEADQMPEISITDAFKKVTAYLTEIHLEEKAKADDSITIYNYYQPLKDSGEGAYYQFNVVFEKPDKEMFIFFIDAMTGDFMTVPLLEHLASK